jgi:large subunit ribosomal protein L9
MDVILLKKVDNLGNLGDRVQVRSGYGRNYLIPSGYAVPATEENIKAFEERRAELEQQADTLLAAAQARKAQLEQLTVAIARKAGDEGRLFGSVGTGDIAKAVQDSGVELGKNEVRLPQGPYRAVGEYEVELHLHSDVNATLRLEVIPEE